MITLGCGINCRGFMRRMVSAVVFAVSVSTQASEKDSVGQKLRCVIDEYQRDENTLAVDWDRVLSADPKVSGPEIERAIEHRSTPGRELVWLQATDPVVRRKCLQRMLHGGGSKPSESKRYFYEDLVKCLAEERDLRRRELDEIEEGGGKKSRNRASGEHWKPDPRSFAGIPYLERVAIPSDIPSCEIICSAGLHTKIISGPDSDPREYTHERARVTSNVYLHFHAEGWGSCLNYCEFHGVRDHLEELASREEPGHFMDIDYGYIEAMDRGRSDGVRDCARRLLQLKAGGMSDREIRQRCRVSNVSFRNRRRLDTPQIVLNDVLDLIDLERLAVLSYRWVWWVRSLLGNVAANDRRELYLMKICSADPAEARTDFEVFTEQGCSVDCEYIWLTSRLPFVRRGMLARMRSLQGEGVFSRHRRLIDRIAGEQQVRLQEIDDVFRELTWVYEKAELEKPFNYDYGMIAFSLVVELSFPSPLKACGFSIRKRLMYRRSYRRSISCTAQNQWRTPISANGKPGLLMIIDRPFSIRISEPGCRLPDTCPVTLRAGGDAWIIVLGMACRIGSLI